MRRGDAGVALFWLVLGAAVCAHALRLGVWDISGPATGFVPLLAGIVLFAGGAGILLAARPWGAPAPPFWPVRAAGLRALTVLVALAVMAAVMPSPRTAHSLRTSSRLVMPPLAITGTFNGRASSTVASMFTPFIMPSRPMSV